MPSAGSEESPFAAISADEDVVLNARFNLTAEDVVAFARFHQQHSREGRRGTRMLRIGILFSLIFVGAAVAKNVEGQTQTWCVFGFVAAVAVMSWFKIAEGQLKAVEARSRKAFLDPQMSQQLGQDRRISLERDVVGEVTPATSFSLRWAAIIEVVLREEAVYFYTSNVSALIVPSHAFAELIDFERFGAIARKRWERAREVKPKFG